MRGFDYIYLLVAVIGHKKRRINQVADLIHGNRLPVLVAEDVNVGMRERKDFFAGIAGAAGRIRAFTEQRRGAEQSEIELAGSGRALYNIGVRMNAVREQTQKLPLAAAIQFTLYSKHNELP